MADNLLIAPVAGSPQPPPPVPEKFRDPKTGAVRVDALLKSYLELERRLSAAPPSAAPPSDGRRRMARPSRRPLTRPRSIRFSFAARWARPTRRRAIASPATTACFNPTPRSTGGCSRRATPQGKRSCSMIWRRSA